MNAAAGPPAKSLPRQTRDYLSWSAIRTYLQCPLRYQFRYLDQLPEEFINATLVFGQAIHAAIDVFYRFQLTSGQRLGLEPLVAAYHDHWSGVSGLDLRYGAQDTLDSFGLLAERMLSVFLAHEVSRPVGEILSIEDEWRASLWQNVPDVLARFDLVVDQGDTLQITDFKTSRQRWSDFDVDLAKGQLLLYGEILSQRLERPVRLQFAVLTKTKQPSLTTHPVVRQPEQIQRQQALIQRVWRSIQGGRFYPQPSVLNCPTCPFQSACQAWTG